MSLIRLLVVLLVALTAGCGGTSSGAAPGQPKKTLLPTPTPAPPASTIIGPPAGSIYLGASVSSASGGIAGLEGQIGRTLALSPHSYIWTANFPGDAESADLLAGRVPVELWSCGPTNAQIVAGDADLLIQTRAVTVLQFGRPVFITYSPDINLPVSTAARQGCLDPATDPGQTFSATEFVAAWQHIRAIFSANGVTNAIWLWTVNSAGASPLPYYPGASQVDWAGLDAYETGNATLAQTLGPTYALLAPLGPPIMITGTGASPLNQPQFFQGAAQVLQSQFGQVEGFIYTDMSPYTLTLAGLPVFTTFAGDPYVSAVPP